MTKGKGFDAVADANEIADHNINPYYWVNKVTSYTYARWMAGKKFAVIALPLYVILWGLFIWSTTTRAKSEQVSLWRLLFDFSNSYSLAVLVQFLLLAIYTVIIVIMVLQLIFSGQPRRLSDHEHRKQKGKKQPKHRKDYH